MNDIEYIKSKGHRNFPTVEVDDVKGFTKLIQMSGSKVIYRITRDEGIYSFFILMGNTAYEINSIGYETIEDYDDAVENGFTDSKVYYEAKKMGYGNFSEFMESKKIGIEKHDVFVLAQKGGFLKNFERFNEKYESYKVCKTTKEIPADIDTATKLFDWANSKKFSTYVDFEKAMDSGFPDYDVYLKAKTSGFKTGEEFYDASKNGFSSKGEYDSAKKLLIRSKREYDHYNYFKTFAKNCLHDEFVLYNEVSRLKDGEYSLDSIVSTYEQVLNQYKRDFDGSNVKILPVWFKCNFKTEQDLTDFLCESELVKKYGSYDPETKMFKRTMISPIKIYIDASNVTRFGAKGDDSFAKYEYLNYVVKELTEKGFSNIIAIADATLKHIAKDQDVLKFLLTKIDYKVAPSHTTADEFLIKAAKADRCLIVSNDTFSDWKVKDRWIANNIDYIRVPFMINQQRAILSGLEKHVG